MRPAFCREAAIDHSPGLQPWVGRLKPMCPESGTRGWGESSRQRTILGLTTFGLKVLVRQSLGCLLRIAPRRAGLGVLSGRIYYPRNPGLKPWSMV
jgi:hypothetical protein